MEVINEQIAIEWWMDYLTGDLTSDREEVLRKFLQDHPDVRAELNVREEIWQKLEQLETPEPSPAMDAKFEASLQGYLAASNQTRRSGITLPQWLQGSWQTGLAFMLVGLVIGALVIPRPQSTEQISDLSQEVMEMKKMMMLTLIEQPKAQERIKAVSMASEFSSADEKVIEVLSTTLQRDDNINVRLAAIESLLRYWKFPEARQALVMSIASQESPLVQVAIADAMLALREKEAIGEFQKLIEEQQLDDAVKTKIETTIDQLKSI